MKLTKVDFFPTHVKRIGPGSSQGKKQFVQIKELPKDRSNTASRSVLNRSRPGTAKTGSDIKPGTRDGARERRQVGFQDDLDETESRPQTEHSRKVHFSATPPAAKHKGKEIKSRVARYIKGADKGDDNSNLLGMYHYERQKKASEKLKQELELFEKLAYYFLTLCFTCLE